MGGLADRTKVVTDKLTIALWAQGFAVVLMSGSPGNTFDPIIWGDSWNYIG